MNFDVGCERGYKYDNFTYDRGNIIFPDGACAIDTNFNSNINLYPAIYTDDIVKGVTNYGRDSADACY